MSQLQEKQGLSMSQLQEKQRLSMSQLQEKQGLSMRQLQEKQNLSILKLQEVFEAIVLSHVSMLCNLGLVTLPTLTLEIFINLLPKT